MTVLYPLSAEILQRFSSRFVKVEPHDGAHSESVDLLWVETTPDDAFSEGEVLQIGPATADHALWFATLDSAYKIGGWPTSWTATGTAAEVLAGVQEALSEGD